MLGSGSLTRLGLDQISFSYLTASYAPNKEIKMSDHIKKININKKITKIYFNLYIKELRIQGVEMTKANHSAFLDVQPMHKITIIF